MQNVYTVKQVNAYIKNMFTQDFMLNRIYVKGEISNCKYHTSGHIYFSLKDQSGTIACVMFAGSRSGLSFRMQEGQQVVVLGSISVYERDGKYQLYAKEIILDGAGLLYEKFEKLKKDLEERGFFASEYKQPIPKFAKRVGIVTAPTGAAVRDIIQVSSRRNPYVQLILYPALVQGEGAAKSIANGIKMLEAADVDVIIVGRGGGSIEDLWAFNEEIVARAIFDCKIPIISAVGHQTDYTIADYVSDLRAPTPSAAAELAVYEYMGTVEVMKEYEGRLRRNITQKIEMTRQISKQKQLKLKMAHPRQKLNEKRQMLVDFEQRIQIDFERCLQSRKHKFAIYVEKMKGLSPLAKLSSGYSYVEDLSHHNLKSVRQIALEDKLRIYMTDGIVNATVTQIEEVTSDEQ